MLSVLKVFRPFSWVFILLLYVHTLGAIQTSLILEALLTENERLIKTIIDNTESPREFRVHYYSNEKEPDSFLEKESSPLSLMPEDPWLAYFNFTLEPPSTEISPQSPSSVIQQENLPSLNSHHSIQKFPSMNHDYDPLISSPGILEDWQLVEFARKRNPSLQEDYLYELSRHYIAEGRIEGINHDIAFAQMLHETGYLRFGGQVHKRQNNFGGLGATDLGEEGLSFSSVQEGVLAHIQHLKAYANRQGLRKINVDPRFYFVNRGSSPRLSQLTGRWATDPQYSKKILNVLTDLYDTSKEARLAQESHKSQGELYSTALTFPNN